MMKCHLSLAGSLPARRNLTLAYAVSLLNAALVTVASVAWSHKCQRCQENCLKSMLSITKTTLVVILLLIVGLPLYAVPATLSLPRGRRPGLKKLTIPQAARQLQGTGRRGRPLVEAARALVAARMQYCRRNSFDTAGKAFERGYGYCQQQAYALTALLTQLGFAAKVVHAFRNRFPDGSVSGHAWVRVTVNGETRYVDSLFYDAQAGRITFTPLPQVRSYTPLFRLLAGWGCTAVNAHRYYVTGKDA